MRDASLGKAAQLAGLSVGQMMTLLAESGVESRVEKDDYLEGLRNLGNAWLLWRIAGDSAQ